MKEKIYEIIEKYKDNDKNVFEYLPGLVREIKSLSDEIENVLPGSWIGSDRYDSILVTFKDENNHAIKIEV